MGNAAFSRSFVMDHLTEKSRIRRAVKSQRKSLSANQQASAGKEIARQARAYRQLFMCHKILAYAPILGEIDPAALLSALTAEIYYPRIDHYRNRSMRFLQSGEIFQSSALGINEPPATNPSLPPRHFDAVLVPLVAFDRSGSRLGMGAGFYDRSFAFRGRPETVSRPLLVGLAHYFQEAETLATDAWDVPLDVIITDRELIII